MNFSQILLLMYFYFNLYSEFHFSDVSEVLPWVTGNLNYWTYILNDVPIQKIFRKISGVYFELPRTRLLYFPVLILVDIDSTSSRQIYRDSRSTWFAGNPQNFQINIFKIVIITWWICRSYFHFPPVNRTQSHSKFQYTSQTRSTCYPFLEMGVYSRPYS